MRGPLPKPDRRRRNAPTISTTVLPASGRKGTIPRPPRWITLGDAGKAWWKWAWRTPQSCRWEHGMAVTVAHRASLEDDLAVVAEVRGIDIGELMMAAEDEEVIAALDRLTALVRLLNGLETGRLNIEKAMLELDRQLGLTPKAFADLRWTLEEVEEEEPEQAEVRRLRSVDRALAGG